MLRTTHNPGTFGIHPRGEITPTELRRMIEMLEDGFQVQEIAERYDLSTHTVCQAIKRARRRAASCEQEQGGGR